MPMSKWAPPGYPIRDPRSTKREVGRIVNPPRTLKMGGKGEATVVPTSPRQSVNAVGPVSDRGKGGRRA